MSHPPSQSGSRPWASFHGGHSAYTDGGGTVMEIAAMADARSFQAYGFSEHLPSPDVSPNDKMPDTIESSEWMPQYVEEVRAAQQRYRGRVRFLLGAEFEYLRGAEAVTRQLIKRWPFEYLVGSVHYMSYDDVYIGIDWDRPRLDEAMRRAGGPEQLQLDYYEHVLELLDWHLAHVLGHIDLIKMLLEPAEQVRTPAITAKVEAVLETVRDHNVALDVNARGLIKPCRAIYPADWILTEAARIGVLPTLGDDSHGPEEVGARLDQAVVTLRQSGFEHMALVHPGGSLEKVTLPG